MAGPGRPTHRVDLDDEQERELIRLQHRSNVARRLVQRAKIILECARGRPDSQVAARLSVNAQTVAKWRMRFLEGGVKALHDQPRSGRPRRVSDLDVAHIITKTLSHPPEGSARWTESAMAKVTGRNESTIRRVWRQCGLQPDRLVCTGFNPDLASYGTWTVAGVYQCFGQQAIAISVDSRWAEGVPPFVWEKAALGRRAPGRLAPCCARSNRAGGGWGTAGAFGDFLDAIALSQHDDRVLFLMVNSPRLQQMGLLHQWRMGSGAIYTCRAANRDAWDDAVRRLAGMMVERQRECAAHGDRDQSVTVLAGSERQCVVWTGCHERGREHGRQGIGCRCKSLRDRRSDNAKKPFRWLKNRSRRSCDCKNPNCWRCCKQRFETICKGLFVAWRKAGGNGRVVSITLTYRASSIPTTAEWLERARRNFASLRARWRRRWGAMPAHLVSLEFTAIGTPHLNLVIPWEGPEHLQVLLPWLRKCWVNIIGIGSNRSAEYKHAVHAWIQKLDVAIRYALKLIEFPRNRRMLPPDTPRFRIWDRSRNWKQA